jgi:DNA-directed RNA polymerase subunit beta
MDVAPSQMVGVSAGLIPFLEHDDANRALMGSNMQRQAVPLLVTEPPIVATGMERRRRRNSSMVVGPAQAGKVTYVDASRIEIGSDVYELKKFVGLNERTCQNQKPIVKSGEKVEKGRSSPTGGHLPRRIGAGAQRAGRLHVVRRLQLRGCDHHQRRAGPKRHLHVDSHRRVRRRDSRNQAGTRRVHPRHPQRQREGPAQSGRNGIVRVGTYVGRATSWSARSRRNRRPN